MFEETALSAQETPVCRRRWPMHMTPTSRDETKGEWWLLIVVRFAQKKQERADAGNRSKRCVKLSTRKCPPGCRRHCWPSRVRKVVDRITHREGWHRSGSRT